MTRLRSLSLPLLLAAAPAFAAVTTLSPIATGSKAAVRASYLANFVPAMPAMGFTGSVAACTPGTISTTFKEWTISRANYYRAMAGLPGTVALDTDATREAQQQSAAVVYAANQLLSHGITNPPYTKCTGLIAAASIAANNSNIGLAMGLASYDDVVLRYIGDDDPGNEAVGHRRWILYPPQASMTVGSTPTSSGVWGGNALRVFNTFGSRPATPNGVAWPPAGYVPIQILPSAKRWSYTRDGAGFGSATVSMQANGVPIASTIISSTASFGDSAIVFVPTPAIVAGTHYTVTVSGMTGSGIPSSYTYTVHPFDGSATIPGPRGDFNANGASDLLFAHSDGRAAIWLMNGTGPASTAEIIGAGTGWSVKQIADFNGDGKSDLVWQQTDGRMAMYLMNGTAPSSTLQLLNAGGWSVTHTPDLNGDGKADLLFQHTDGTVAVWTMNGTTMTSGASIIGAGTGWSVIATGDFDGDGMDDLVWKHTDGRHAIWLMNGVAVKSTNQLLNAGGWTAAHVADLNGDGKADIVWQHTDGTIAAWLMNGAAMGTGAGLLGAGSGWSVARTGDFNGDGKADLLFQHTDGRAAIYLMNGLTPASTAQILSAGGGWSAKRVVDLNGDGKADIAWQNTDGSTAAWLMNGTTMTSSAGLLGAASGWSISSVSQ